jgi:hypothetical protein
MGEASTLGLPFGVPSQDEEPLDALLIIIDKKHVEVLAEYHSTWPQHQPSRFRKLPGFLELFEIRIA